jgi:hypothetical protein
MMKQKQHEINYYRRLDAAIAEPNIISMENLQFLNHEKNIIVFLEMFDFGLFQRNIIRLLERLNVGLRKASTQPTIFCVKK